MTAVWVCAALALAAVVARALRLSAEAAAPQWPEEAPLKVRDDRAHDLQLTHLTRLVGADDPRAAHEVVVGLVDELVRTSYVERGPDDDPYAALSPAVRRFLADPPLASADRYRRDLDAALSELEQL